jgi:peptidoglycan/xylan/chitin deacetylase (PgdA/CDA1 family)
VQQAADYGHELANHTWAHKDLTQHNEEPDAVSLERTHELLTKLTGQAPTLCRPPYGRIDSVGLAVCADMHYNVLLWSGHITGSNARNDVSRVLREVSPGSVVLAHDGGPEPNPTLMQQLDRLVGSLKDDGYQFLTASELLAVPDRSTA